MVSGAEAGGEKPDIAERANLGATMHRLREAVFAEMRAANHLRRGVQQGAEAADGEGAPAPEE